MESILVAHCDVCKCQKLVLTRGPHAGVPLCPKCDLEITVEALFGPKKLAEMRANVELEKDPEFVAARRRRLWGG